MLKGGAGDFKPSAEVKPGEKPVRPAVPAIDAETSALVKALVQAGAAKQIALIKDYEAAKGATYSVALAEAIPQLAADAKSQARDALANRMARLSAKSLQSWIQQGVCAMPEPRFVGRGPAWGR